ncbi:hypothetical protein M378DRAFT_351110 [Amanita muscaria Koide BX008]|uniref:Uncharacterized protein n=1 Tax=Amanita muscaria (strain Koide BX008) TaxID=946122 RepID=A0A0C2TIM4_AMAMK|nr:hypothetical protein M378DRAFT_351110 [Amanita muscaria Koide BX008]
MTPVLGRTYAESKNLCCHLNALTSRLNLGNRTEGSHGRLPFSCQFKPTFTRRKGNNLITIRMGDPLHLLSKAFCLNGTCGSSLNILTFSFWTRHVLVPETRTEDFGGRTIARIQLVRLLQDQRHNRRCHGPA